MALFKRGWCSKMGKKGKIGAFDEKERERRQKITQAFYRALRAKDTRGFWHIIRDAGIPEESEMAVKLYEQWREVIGEVWRHND